MSTTTTTRRSMRLQHGIAIGMATLLFSLVISSCGGGGVGSGGTGAPETSFGAGSYGSGTVTGFGSLVVDGISYADTQVPVTIEAQPNAHTPHNARLGHFTELEFGESSGPESVRAIRIEAAAVGKIDTVDAAAHVIKMLGQTIVENRSPDAGPVTFYSAVAGLHALRAGDVVEIHGVPRWNDLSARHEVLATRIEKLQGAVATRRLAGVVQNTSGGGTNRAFRLGALQITYSTSSTLPAGAVPRDGDRVVVWSDQLPSEGSLAAKAVRVVSRSLPAAGKTARIGGTVSRFDASGHRFELAGVVVLYGNATVTPSGKSFSLGNGAYVVVEGTYAADGALEANHVGIRKRDESDDDDDDDDDDEHDSEVKLTGPIENFVSAASFTVRGTTVDALGVSLRGCGNASLRNGLNVRVEGQVQANLTSSLVKAESVRCVN